MTINLISIPRKVTSSCEGTNAQEGDVMLRSATKTPRPTTLVSNVQSSRPPDHSGLDYWSPQITASGTTQIRIDTRQARVSGAYSFLTTELQESGAELTSEGPSYASLKAKRIGDFKANASRGRVYEKIADADAKVADVNHPFVLMQCVGLLRFDPDQHEYQIRLNNLNNDPNDFCGLVCAFINSVKQSLSVWSFS